MKAVLLSLKPEFASRLLSGAKTAEIRKRFPILAPGTTVYAYASTPVKAIVGTLRLDAVHRGTPAELWSEFGSRLGITKSYFDRYLDAREEATLLELFALERWSSPTTLDQLRNDIGVEPPQSYRYLTEAHERLLTAPSS